MLQPELSRAICRTDIDPVQAADYLESIGNLVDLEMIPQYRRQTERGTQMSPQARERTRALAEAVSQPLRRALRTVDQEDRDLAHAVLDTKPQVRSLERVGGHS
jgi:Na+/phosphate symporter